VGCRFDLVNFDTHLDNINLFGVHSHHGAITASPDALMHIKTKTNGRSTFRTHFSLGCGKEAGTKEK
jgi:hypothetical protein